MRRWNYFLRRLFDNMSSLFSQPVFVVSSYAVSISSRWKCFREYTNWHFHAIYVKSFLYSNSSSDRLKIDSVIKNYSSSWINRELISRSCPKKWAKESVSNFISNFRIGVLSKQAMTALVRVATSFYCQKRKTIEWKFGTMKWSLTFRSNIGTFSEFLHGLRLPSARLDTSKSLPKVCEKILK